MNTKELNQDYFGIGTTEFLESRSAIDLTYQEFVTGRQINTLSLEELLEAVRLLDVQTIVQLSKSTKFLQLFRE